MSKPKVRPDVLKKGRTIERALNAGVHYIKLHGNRLKYIDKDLISFKLGRKWRMTYHLITKVANIMSHESYNRFAQIR